MSEWPGMNRGALDLAQAVDQPKTLINPRMWRGGELSRRLGMARSNIPRQDGPILGISGFSPRPGSPSGGLFQGGEWEGITEIRALWGGGSGGGSDDADFTFAILDDYTGSWFFYASYSGEIESIANVGENCPICQPVFVSGSWYVFDGVRYMVRLDMDGTQTIVADTDDGGGALVPSCMCYDGATFAILVGPLVYTQTGYNTWTQTYSVASAGYTTQPSIRGLYGTTNGTRMGWLEYTLPTWRRGECGTNGTVTTTVLTSDPSAGATDAMPGSAIFSVGVGATLATTVRTYYSAGDGETWQAFGGPTTGIYLTGVLASMQTGFGSGYATLLSDINDSGIETSRRDSRGAIILEGVDTTGDRLTLGVACGTVENVYCLYYHSASGGYFITRNSDIVLDIANETVINVVTDSPATLIVAEL